MFEKTSLVLVLIEKLPLVFGGDYIRLNNMQKFVVRSYVRVY